MIPKGWQKLELQNVSDFENGQAHENIVDENGEYILVTSKFVSTEGREFRRVTKRLSPLEPGDIAIVMSDIPNGKALAKCFLVTQENKFTLNQRIGKIRAKDADPGYLFYALNRNPYYLQFDSGVGQTNLKKSEVLECPINVPPISEQKKIAGILSTWDRAIDGIDRLLNECNRAKSVIARNVMYPQKGVKMTWRTLTFAEIGSIVEGQVDPKEEPYSSMWHIGPGNIEKNTGVFSDVKTAKEDGQTSGKYLFDDDHILYGKINPHFAKVCFPKFKGVCSADVYPIRANKVVVSSDFLFELLLGSQFTKYAISVSARTGMPKINRNDLDVATFEIPDLAWQHKVANSLKGIRKEIELLTALKKNLVRQKQGLMQKLLTGKVRVKV